MGNSLSGMCGTGGRTNEYPQTDYFQPTKLSPVQEGKEEESDEALSHRAFPEPAPEPPAPDLPNVLAAVPEIQKHVEELRSEVTVPEKPSVPKPEDEVMQELQSSVVVPKQSLAPVLEIDPVDEPKSEAVSWSRIDATIPAPNVAMPPENKDEEPNIKATIQPMRLEDQVVPSQPTQPIKSTTTWIIIGGADKGGMLVRTGLDLKSSELPERIATGATIEEIKRVGDRLNFRKIKGNGPKQGWITTKVKGRDMLEAT